MGSNPVIRTRKRLRIGYNSESFSTKSTFSGGINRIYDEIPHAWDEIRLDGGWVDLISSEVAHRRFHPNSFGFHPAKQDFIKFVWLAGIVFVLASFFVFSRKIQIVHFIPLSFNLWGIVQLLI